MKNILATITSVLFISTLTFSQVQSGNNTGNANLNNGNQGGVCTSCPNSNNNSKGGGNQVQDGNQDLGLIYEQHKCGLNWVQVSHRLKKRGGNGWGINQPATYTVTGIPAGAVIEQAWLWSDMSGTATNHNCTIVNPNSVQYIEPMALIGTCANKCWGSYQATTSYRADVTNAIIGNGNYIISGLPTDPPTPWKDTDGATLFIIYSDPNVTDEGHIVIWDGCWVGIGGNYTGTENLPNPVCDNSINANAFCIIADLQLNGSTVNMNGNLVNIAWDWWNFEQTPTTYNNGQNNVTYTFTNGAGDCFNFMMAGAWWTTNTCTSCVTCEPPTSDSTDVTCYGGCDGSAIVYANMDSSSVPLTFEWFDSTFTSIAIDSITNDTIDTITGLCAGTYYVEITDSAGQVCRDTIIINEPPQLIPSDSTIADATCNGYCDGQGMVSAVGGTPPYSYLWPSGNTSDTENGLCAGVYTVTITDDHGCDTTVDVTIIEPAIITVQAFEDDTICQTEQAFIYATATGGDGNYVWDWNNGQFNNDTITPSPGTTTTYTVSVTDSTGCPGATETITITVLDFLQLEAFRDTTICLGDSTILYATASGGDGNYTYTWSNGIGVDNYVWVFPNDTTTYYVTVNDGCSTPVVVDSVTVVVGNYANPQFIAENNVGCSPLTVTFVLDTIINGYTYAWNFGDGDGATSFSQTVNHTYTLGGTEEECYDIGLTVTTELGCVTEVNFDCMVTVYPNPIADFTMDPIRATNLDPIIEFYDMSFGANSWEYWLGDGTIIDDKRNFYHTYLDTGAYDVTQIVQNKYGCTDTITKTVFVDYQSTIYFPNAFTPEQKDGINDGFGPVFEGISDEDYQFFIFDRWGQVLFTTTDNQEKWDGTHYKTGNPVPQGVYVYLLKYKHFDGLKNEVRGHVTLIR